MPNSTNRIRNLAVIAAAVCLPMAAMAQERSETPRNDRMEAPSAPSTGTAAPNMRSAVPENMNSSAATTSSSVDVASATSSDALIGANVRNSGNEVVGKVDSLLIGNDSQVVGLVVDVGGFLGIGAHQVVVPMDQISMLDDGNVSLPSATKESLKAAPAYKAPDQKR